MKFYYRLIYFWIFSPHPSTLWITSLYIHHHRGIIGGCFQQSSLLNCILYQCVLYPFSFCLFLNLVQVCQSSCSCLFRHFITAGYVSRLYRSWSYFVQYLPRWIMSNSSRFFEKVYIFIFYIFWVIIFRS